MVYVSGDLGYFSSSWFEASKKLKTGNPGPSSPQNNETSARTALLCYVIIYVESGAHFFHFLPSHRCTYLSSLGEQCRSGPGIRGWRAASRKGARAPSCVGVRPRSSFTLGHLIKRNLIRAALAPTLTTIVRALLPNQYNNRSMVGWLMKITGGDSRMYSRSDVFGVNPECRRSCGRSHGQWNMKQGKDWKRKRPMLLGCWVINKPTKML